MARPVLRVVRTPQPGQHAALTASATPNPLIAASAPVTDTSQLFKSTAGPKSRNWQAEAWDHYRCVGEFGYVVRDRARSCSRVKLIASELDPDTGQPTGGLPTDADGELTAEAARVAWYVRSIAGGALGQAEYIKRAAINLQVPGEYQSAIIVTDKGERWLVLNKNEIKRAQRARRGRAVGDPIDIKLPEGGTHPYDPDKGDGMFRVWNAAGWEASEPDSPARAAQDPLREIRRCSAKIEAADDSRLFGNGLLVIPQEASLPSSAAPTAADKPGAAGSPSAQVTGQQVAATLQDLLVKAGTYALKHGGPARVAPTVIGAPAEHVDKIKHVKIADEATPVALATREKAIGRLAMSLDIPAEKLLGVGSNTNHWSSYQISDEDVQLHIKPIMQEICQAIYVNVLRDLLVADGIDPDKYTLWFDASEITADPDKSDEASEAQERGMFTGAEYRRHKGLPEDAGFDLDTRAGWEQLAREQAAADLTLIPSVLPLLPKELQGLDWPEQAPPSADDGDHGDPPEEVPVDGSEPDTEDDARQAAAISGPLAYALAEQTLVFRGLEMYGKRVRTRADANRLANVPFEETHRFMPAADESEIPRLIAGWDKSLTDPRIANLGIDLEALRSSAYQVIRRELTSTVVEGQVL